MQHVGTARCPLPEMRQHGKATVLPLAAAAQDDLVCRRLEPVTPRQLRAELRAAAPFELQAGLLPGKAQLQDAGATHALSLIRVRLPRVYGRPAVRLAVYLLHAPSVAEPEQQNARSGCLRVQLLACSIHSHAVVHRHAN